MCESISLIYFDKIIIYYYSIQWLTIFKRFTIAICLGIQKGKIEHCLEQAEDMQAVRETMNKMKTF